MTRPVCTADNRYSPQWPADTQHPDAKVVRVVEALTPDGADWEIRQCPWCGVRFCERIGSAAELLASIHRRMADITEAEALAAIEGRDR